ncbi:PIN domain-containing protein [Rickettsia endosymbiont of Lasioglossum villosulum]|uniref:PIN domain-containing protein n=1 Tax=Rickettsia endosymbiont of Lasioglossum villosulum TaxID=3066269 RepID=UPI0031333924
MKYICDTNFIVRYLVANDQNMFDKAKEIFEKVKTGQIILILEQTTFTEIVFVLSSVYKVSRSEIFTNLSGLLAYKGIHCEKEYYLAALEYYSRHNIHIVDCILLAKAKFLNILLLTFDQKLLNLSNKNDS